MLLGWSVVNNGLMVTLQTILTWAKQCMQISTVVREFFVGEIFRRLNFHVALFLSLWRLDNINLLHLHVYVKENISSVSFSSLKVINENFAVMKISQSTIFAWHARWNLIITATYGPNIFGCYTEVAALQRYKYIESHHLGLGKVAVIMRWVLNRVTTILKFHCTYMYL